MLIILVDKCRRFSALRQKDKIFAIVTENHMFWESNLYEAEELKLIPSEEPVCNKWTNNYGAEGETFEFSENCKFLYLGTPDGLLQIWEFLPNKTEFPIQNK